MTLTRSSGILLHPTSFPSLDGIGDLGPQAYYWIDFLKSSGCSVWQILPLGPTGYGDSPYQAFSAFAGNPYLISSTIMLDEGLLSPDDLSDRPKFPEHKIDYGAAIQWKLTILNRAYKNYKNEPSELEEEFDNFRRHNAGWLPDFSLFMSIKETENGRSWIEWPEPLRKRDPKSLHEFSIKYRTLIEQHAFRQFLFFRQWLNLKKYANSNGITIVGDIPIFASMDSADVWSNPELFYLDEEGHPTVVSGVPPDYFSPTGQLWGNPLYKWSEHEKTGFEWWIKRVKSTLVMADLIRLDHFRGFCGYWEVPAGEPTAIRGRWVQGPGELFLNKLRESLGNLPLIAEDLGEITQDVVDLRDSFDLPGMRIFQFGFSDDARNLFLPHNYITNCIAYTGTHDNDTAIGWYQTTSENEQDFARRYLSTDGSDISWKMVSCLWSSVAVYAIAPLQDLLSLGTDARMNFPGHAEGNWSYRFKSTDLTPDLAFRILDLNRIYNRIPSLNIQPPSRPIILYEKP